MRKNVTIILVIFMIIAISLIIMQKNRREKFDLEQQGYCIGEEAHFGEVGGSAMTHWRCQICGKADLNSTTNVPTLCFECAQKTNRCQQCGKKLEKN